MSTDLLSLVPEWEREADVHEQKARALRQMAEAVRVLNGDAVRLLAFEPEKSRRSGANQYAAGGAPRGREAVRRIVAERPGEWYVRDIKKINRERGWPSDDAGIETAVIRMAQADEAAKISKGFYRFGASAPHEPARTSNPHASGEGAS